MLLDHQLHVVVIQLQNNKQFTATIYLFDEPTHAHTTPSHPSSREDFVLIFCLFVDVLVVCLFVCFYPTAPPRHLSEVNLKVTFLVRVKLFTISPPNMLIICVLFSVFVIKE